MRAVSRKTDLAAKLNLFLLKIKKTLEVNVDQVVEHRTANLKDAGSNPAKILSIVETTSN